MSDGRVQFRTSMPIQGQPATPKQIKHLLRDAFFYGDRYCRALARLLSGGDLSPAEVLAEVEMA